MLARTTALLATLGLVACGGSQAPAPQPQPPAGDETSQPADNQAQPDDGQAVDDEVPPGLGFFQAFKGNRRVAAPTDEAAVANAKQQFDEFVRLTMEMANKSSQAASCAGVAEALEGWRMHAIPIARDHFAAIDAYVDGMTEEQEKALEEKMRPAMEGFMKRMQECHNDEAVQKAMQQLMIDMQQIAEANGQGGDAPADDSGDEAAPE